MEENAKYPVFQDSVKHLWRREASRLYNSLTEHMTAFAEKIRFATACDYTRWPQYGCADIDQMLITSLNLIEEKKTFLISQWGGYEIVNQLPAVKAVNPTTDCNIYDLQGRRVHSPHSIHRPGIYLVDRKKIIVR